MKILPLLLLFPLSLVAADPTVDSFNDMEASSSGTTLNNSIVQSSDFGTGTWTVVGSGMQVNTIGETALRGPITITGGSGYTDSGTRSWRIPDKADNQYVYWDPPGADKAIVVVSGYIRFGPNLNAYGRYDYIVVGGGASGLSYAVLQLEDTGNGGYFVWIETWQGSTTHSAQINVQRDKVYWFSMRVNETSGLCQLAMFDPVNWNQVGSTVQNTIGTKGNVNLIKFGNAVNHNNAANPNTTYSYMDDICINWTDTTFPFLPSASSSNPPTITTQPVGVTNGTDQGFLLSAVATGDGTLTYRWRTNGVVIPIGNGNNTYGNSPAFTLQSSDFYTLQVSNAFGVVTSDVVKVLITNSIVPPPPTLAGIPVDRIPTNVWAVSGVSNGIPTRSTVFTNLNAGVSATVLNWCIANCPSNQVVYLNAGTYNIGTLTFSSSDNWTLRGAGMGQTILNFTSGNNGHINIGQSPPFNGSWANTVNITTATDTGASNIIVSSASGWSVGDMAVIDMANTATIYGYGTGGGTSATANNDSAGKARDGNRVQLFYTRVVGISGTTFSIWPPLPFALDTGRSPQISEFGNSSLSNRGPRNWGIEDLTLDCSGDYKGIVIVGAWNWWLNKVEIKDWGNLAAVWVRRSTAGEIRGCYIHDPSTKSVDHGYGMMLDPLCASRVEDNIVTGCMSTFLFQGGSAGNVVAYNVMAFGDYENGGYTGEWLQHEISGNHTPYPCYNLYEGNYTAYFQSDYYYGPSGFGTLYRNRIPGNSTATTQHRLCVSIDSNQRGYSVVGNQLGELDPPNSVYLALPDQTRNYQQPNPISWTYDMVGDASYSAPHIFRLGYPYSGQNSTSSGLATNDTFVKTNTFVHMNWDAANQSITYAQAATDFSFPDSLFLTAKPAYFNNLAWPPYNSNAPPAAGIVADLEKIPAGWRLLYNEDPPSGEPEDEEAPTVTAFVIPSTANSLTVAISTFTATDDTAVVGYAVTESATPPAAEDGVWSGAAPTSYTFGSTGSKTLYGWAKDAAGNVSASVSDSVDISIGSRLEVTGALTVGTPP